MLKIKLSFFRYFLVAFLLIVAGCGGGKSSSENAMDALACTSVNGSTLTNNCEFNVFAEVLTGSNDDSGTDFFIPVGSSIVLPVTGEFTYGVCRGPSRPKKQGEGFVCD